MPTAIAINNYEQKRPTEIDLWGQIFHYIAITKKTEPKINDAASAIAKSFIGEDLTLHSVQVEMFAKKMDVRLRPIPGSKKRASTLLKAKWAEDQLTVPQIDQFWEAVEEAVTAGEAGPVAIESFAGAAVSVDLWGSDFEAVRITASTEPPIRAKVEEINKRFFGRDVTHQERVEMFGMQFDARLRPAEEDGRLASELVREKWDADEVTVPQLERFWSDVLEAIDRPS